jgi:cyanophycin synthetase
MPGNFATAVEHAETMIRIYQPDFIACALMRAARKRGVPVYPVSPGSRIWLYGQGSAGLRFFEVANQRDSFTRSLLARNKFLSNQFITRLGFPGATHGIAKDPQSALHIAQKRGFPVVVKLLDLGKGRGVTTEISSGAELAAAFAKAIAASPKGALVERHIRSEDHRLAVIGGKLAWAVQRSPPRMVGDGSHTIAELIEEENRRRNDADVAAGFVTRLAIDADMLAVLSKQGFALEDRPQPGTSVRLRSIPNTSTGGQISDCTPSVHPDNREMVESIARGLRMDMLGIDFVTPDISRSWRELDCAVIEVNARPGFSSDERALTSSSRKVSRSSSSSSIASRRPPLVVTWQKGHGNSWQ